MKKDITKYCVKNPDKTVKEIMEKFKIDVNVAFYYIQEAGKELGKLN